MVNLASLFGSAFAAVYDDATLHVRTRTDDGTGTITSVDTDHACKAQLDAASQAMRAGEGFSESDVRILVLASSLAVTPSTSDEITAGGRRWQIASVAQDPASTHWDIRGRRKA